MIVSVSWPRGSKCQGGSRSEGEREEREETKERGGGGTKTNQLKDVVQYSCLFFTNYVKFDAGDQKEYFCKKQKKLYLPIYTLSKLTTCMLFAQYIPHAHLLREKGELTN